MVAFLADFWGKRADPMLALAPVMKMSRMFSRLLLLAALTAGCGSSDSGAGGAGGASGTSGGGSAGAGAVDPRGPLLDRPSGDEYDCSVSRPITLFDLPWSGFTLVPDADGELALVRADRNKVDPKRTGSSVTWSTLGLDGTLGSPNAVSAPTNQYLTSVTAVRGGEKSTIVWSETLADGSSYSMNSLQVDAAGSVVTPASVLLTLGRSGGLKVVRAGSGYALLWVDGNQSSAKLSFGLLDENGKLASTPLVLAQAPYLGVGDIAPVGAGFVVSYADNGYLNSRLASRLLVLDADGSTIGEPIALEDTHGSASSLLVRGDQVLAAWSILHGDKREAMEAATTVRVGRFDAKGKRQGPMYDLQAPVTHRESVQPFWVEMGDDVGLLWAEGSIIYICAGCVPDHSLKFVVLDGQDFNPRSNAVELTNTLPAGGLLSPESARIGDHLLVVSTVTYHTSAEGASGTLRCAR
jgi:hypothetical protein